VLILLTEHSFTTYANGHVSTDGQQDFHNETNVQYAGNRVIVLRNIDTDTWSEISE
jgi:hypothetical protein